MDDLGIFGTGCLVGFVVTAGSYGPLSLLFARRALVQGRWIGFLSGVGVAAGDGIASAIAALGLSFVTAFLEEHHTVLRLAGGLILVAVGLHMARMVPSGPPPRASTSTLAGAFLSTLGLTLATPSGIPVWLGLFATFGVPVGRADVAAAVVLGFGIFVGSSLLRLIQTFVLDALRARLAVGRLRFLSLSAGIVVLCFAAYALASGVFELVGVAQ